MWTIVIFVKRMTVLLYVYGRDFPTKLLVSILVFVILRLQFYFVNYVIVSCELPYYNSFGQRMLLKN